MKAIVSPQSYFILEKADMHQEWNLFDQKDEPDRLALGGIYEIISEESDCYILKPEKNSKYEVFKTPKYFLKIDDDKQYDFKLNDIVIFSPTCTDLEIQSLTYNENLVIGHKYKVVRIINYYYLELLNEKGDVSNPIRFCDVQKVEDEKS